MFPTTLATLRRSSAQARPFLRPVFLVGAILTFLFTSISTPTADISSVSGYYGPGAVLAWLFALINTVMTCEGAPVSFPIWAKMRNYIFNDARTPSTTETGRDEELFVDTTIISIIAYPTVSAIDFLLRQTSSRGIDTQAEASVAIAKLFLASACLLGAMGPAALQNMSSTRRSLWLYTVTLNQHVLLRTRSAEDKASFMLVTTIVITYPVRWFLMALLNGWAWPNENFPSDSFGPYESSRMVAVLSWIIAKLAE